MYNYISLFKTYDNNKCKGDLDPNLLKKKKGIAYKFYSGVFVTFDKFHPLKIRRKEPNF